MISAPPPGFSWIEENTLAASARPESPEELHWLRQQGIEFVITLTEQPLRRDWVNQAGLMVMHVPIIDMDAPTQDQFDQCISAIARARERKLGVLVHCFAGIGRTGTILAAYFVSQGDQSATAIQRIRQLRPGSIETPWQIEAVEQYARRLHAARSADPDAPPQP